MTKTQEKTNLSDLDVLEAYRAAEQLKPAAFARALGVSRQRMFRWLNGIADPSTEWLVEVSRREGWQGDMAIDMLKQRQIYVVRVQVAPSTHVSGVADDGLKPSRRESVEA